MKTVDIEPILSSITLFPASIKDFAIWKASQGHHIVEKNNLYWHEAFKGFYQPIHILQELHQNQIHSPKMMAWGVRGALKKSEQFLANGAIEYYTLPNLNSFDFSMFSQKRRENIRKCFRRVEIKEIKDENILLEQGYDVVRSSLERTHHASIPTKEKYLANGTAYVNRGDNSHMVLGAFEDNKLLAFLELSAVEDTVYLVTMMIASEALKHGVSSGLFYTSFELSKYAPGVRRMFAGGRTSGHETLDVFKQSMGMSIVKEPFWSNILSSARFVLKHKYPQKYNRLIGGLV